MKFQVYDSSNNIVAELERVDDAVSLINGNGWTIRIFHSHILWTYGIDKPDKLDDKNIAYITLCIQGRADDLLAKCRGKRIVITTTPRHETREYRRATLVTSVQDVVTTPVAKDNWHDILRGRVSALAQFDDPSYTAEAERLLCSTFSEDDAMHMLATFRSNCSAGKSIMSAYIDTMVSVIEARLR